MYFFHFLCGDVPAGFFFQRARLKKSGPRRCVCSGLVSATIFILLLRRLPSAFGCIVARNFFDVNRADTYLHFEIK